MYWRHYVAPVAIVLSLFASRCPALTPETADSGGVLNAEDAISWATLPVVEQVYYDYDRAIKLLDTSRVTIPLNVTDGALPPGDLYVTVEGQKLEGSSKSEYWNTQPRLVDGKLQIVIDGLDSATVYRFRVCVKHHGQELGKLPYWFFAATTSYDRVEHARAEIVMSAFREWNAFNYRRVGPSRYNGGAWCSNFYRFVAATRFKDFGPPGTWAGMGIDSHFRGAGAITNSGQLVEVGRHGDYIRLPGHTAMLLAYDHDTGYIWTIEGNYSNSVRIKQRRLYSGWTLGCITDHQLTEDCRLLPIE